MYIRGPYLLTAKSREPSDTTEWFPHAVASFSPSLPTSLTLASAKALPQPVPQNPVSGHSPQDLRQLHQSGTQGPVGGEGRGHPGPRLPAASPDVAHRECAGSTDS